MKIFKHKKLLSLFTLFFLLVTQLPLHVDATNTSGDIFLIGDSIYSDISQNKNGNGWYWDAANFTLTLDGYNGGPVFFIPSSQSSKTLQIIVKKNNSLRYDGVPANYPASGRTSFAALLVENCNVHISGGGTLSTNASGKGGSCSLSASNNVTIENITLNCVGQYQSFSCENITVKKSVLNIDSPEGYWCISALFENSTISLKNSRSNGNEAESFASGGRQTFKNCSVDVLVGAGSSNSTPTRTTLFDGIATYVFDNTVFKVRQGQHNHGSDFITLFSLGYPSNEGNGITIKNNSRFELSDCVDDVFRAFEINVSNSSITGKCTNNLFSSILLNITNSNVDITCAGNTPSSSALIVGQDINISNSNIKGRVNGNVWGPSSLSYSEYEKNLSLIDTHLDLEGKVDTFVDSCSLNYTTPEKWIVILDGAESDLSVNSPKLNLRHGKVVIKYDENLNASQPAGTKNPPKNDSSTPSKEPTNQSVPEQTINSDSKETVENDTTPQKVDNNEPKQTVDKGTTSKKTDKKDKGPNFIIIIILPLVIGIVGATTYIYIRRKKG